MSILSAIAFTVALGTVSPLTEVTVRTSDRYLTGTRCDPEVVALVIFDHSGIVDSACKSVSVEKLPTPGTFPAGGITVTLGAETFYSCQLVATQRNHYPDTLYTAWSFNCAD